MIRETARKLRGSLLVLAHLPGQRRAPYAPPEQWQAARDLRLRNTVCYAVETVPYYRDLFRNLGIDAREIQTVKDLDRLPLLDKTVVRRNPELFVSASRLGERAIPFVTSGSTGSPLTVRHDRRSLLVNIAYGERERGVLRLARDPESGYRELYINYSASTVRKVWNFYRRNTFLSTTRTERLLLTVDQPVLYVVAAINHFRPHVIVSYGSYLEALYRIVAARDLRMHRPRLLMVTADGMTGPGKRFIEDEFGVPVYSRYNAMESFKIGFTCPAGTGFHLHEDLCFVKLVGNGGEEVPEGERGEVVISNLVNRGTVLLNYRLGDYGIRSGGSCACGRTLPLLSTLEGRVEDVLHLPDGRLVHPRSVWNVFKSRPEVLRYQLIQHEPERFELRIVAVDRRTFDRVLPAISAELRSLLGKVALEPVLLKELIPGPAGKFRPVISCGGASLPGSTSHVSERGPKSRSL